MVTTTKTTTVAVPTYGSKVTDTSGNVGVAKFNPNTGAALSPTTSSGGSSSSNINNYNPNTGQLLKPGETVTNKATGETITQGTEFKPTPVVSGSTAASQINNQIVPAMNDAKNAIATQALTKAEQKKANIKLQEDLNATFAGQPGYQTLLTDGIIGPKTKAAMAYKVPEKKKEETAEDKIASELTPGSVYIYDQKTGAEKQIPATEPLPLGYSKSKPIIPVQSDEVQLFSGDKVVKMSDGTYKLMDMAGNELGTSSETTFTQGKQANDVLTNLNNAMNGNYPLKPEQEAQIQGIQNSYQQLIKQQQTDNANAAGGMTIAMNRYGLGDQLVGQGNITGIINAGAQEVANLNTKMASAVAEMTSAFKSDNLDALKTSYTAFKDSQDSLQSNIDKMQSATAAVLKAQQDAITKRQEDLTKTITDTQKSAREAGVPPEVVASLSDSTDVKDMYNRLGDYAISATGIIGEYAAYKNEAISKGLVPMDFNSYQNVDANRKKSIAAAGVAGSSGLNSKQEMYYDRIAKEYTNDTFIKNQSKFSAFRSIAEKIKADPSNAANQLAGLYTLVKVLDPDSAVREGEVWLAQLTQSTTDNLKVQVERLAQGKIMTADTATKLAEGVLSLTDSWENVAAQRTNLYVGKAQGHGPEVADAVKTFIDFDKSFVPTGTKITEAENTAKASIDDFNEKNPQLIMTVANLYKALPGANDSKVWAYMKLHPETYKIQ